MQLWAKKLDGKEKEALKRIMVLTKQKLNLHSVPESRPILHLRDVPENSRDFIKDPMIKTIGDILNHFNAYRNAVDRQTSEVKDACVEMLLLRIAYLEKLNLEEANLLVAEQKQQQQEEKDHARRLRIRSPTHKAVSVVFKGQKKILIFLGVIC